MSVNALALMKSFLVKNLQDITANKMGRKQLIFLICHDHNEANVKIVAHLLQNNVSSPFELYNDVNKSRDANLEKSLSFDLVLLGGDLISLGIYEQHLNKSTIKEAKILGKEVIMICNKATSIDIILRANELGIFHFNSIDGEAKSKKFVSKVNALLDLNLYKYDIFPKLLENLISLSYVDTITGLFNRSYFDSALEVLTKELDNSIGSNDNSLYLLIIDLDKFKNINDNYGHLGGDKILRCVGEIFAKVLAEIVNSSKEVASGNCNEDYFISRIGGDEFAVVVNRKFPSNKISHIADLLLKTVENGVFSVNDKVITSVRISIGLTKYVQFEGVSTFMERADTALFRAKNCGRNNVCITF